MISGRHVQAWVKDHCNGQKTDLNDAFAILNLAYDRWLTPIRGKTREECRLLALQASYCQLKGQRTKTMVYVKATPKKRVVLERPPRKQQQNRPLVNNEWQGTRAQ